MSQLPIPQITQIAQPYYPIQVQNNSHPQANFIKVQQKDGSNYDLSHQLKDQFVPRVLKKNANSDQYNPPAYFMTKNNLNQKQSNNIFKQFVNCVCKGKISDNQRFFQCGECKKKFHLKCLHIPNNAVEKEGVEKQCPQCSFKNMNANALYTVIGEPLQSFWSYDKQLHKQKITIKSKKCKQILQKNYHLQFRFLKIEGRCMYDWDGLQDKQDNKLKKSKLNEVIIKDDTLSKGGGEDVKINVDCMKTQQKSEQKKSTLLYVAINIVKQKSIQQILSSHYQVFQDNYLDRFFKDKNQIKIYIANGNSKLFNIPVRGEDCQHPQLFQLEEFVNHCLNQHTDICCFCLKKCRRFKIDRKIEKEIKRIKNIISDESKQPHVIYYQKDGRFLWNGELGGRDKKLTGNGQGISNGEQYQSISISESIGKENEIKIKNNNNKTKRVRKQKN